MIIIEHSSESVVGLLVSSLRAFLVVIVATTMSFAGTDLTRFLTKDLPGAIHNVVTDDDEDVEDSIDDNLKAMGLIFALMDALIVIV